MTSPSPAFCAEQRALIEAALPLVVFEGWSPRLLGEAAASIGISAFDARRLFPDGVTQVLAAWSAMADAQMMETLQNDTAYPTRKIRERIHQAVMVRLHQNAPHREAVRRALAYYALPWNTPQALSALYATVDAMWRTAGDTATDYNFYTKRLTLAHVYSSTLMVWLADSTENLADTEAFLNRRIAEVMQIEKWKHSLRQRASGICAS